VERILAASVAVAACAAAVAATALGGGRPAATCGPALPDGLASIGAAEQVVSVVVPRSSSTRATLRLWRLSGGCWVAAGGPWPAWVGQRGVSENRHEGDRTTPAGAFGIGPKMYGVAADPGVRYPYRRVRCGDWWVEDPRSPYYNRFHHVPCGTRPPFRVTDEELAHSPTAYRHFAVIAFNVDPIVPGRGSGIFLHASTGRPTVGCVSLDVPHLVTTLRWLRPAADPVIVIGTRAMIRQL